MTSRIHHIFGFNLTKMTKVKWPQLELPKIQTLVLLCEILLCHHPWFILKNNNLHDSIFPPCGHPLHHQVGWRVNWMSWFTIKENGSFWKIKWLRKGPYLIEMTLYDVFSTLSESQISRWTRQNIQRDKFTHKC